MLRFKCRGKAAHGLRAVEKAGRAGGCDGPGRRAGSAQGGATGRRRPRRLPHTLRAESGAGSGQQAAVLLLYALLGKEGKAVRRIAPVGLRRGRAKREQADGAQHKPQKQHEKTHFTPSFPKTQNNKNKTFHPI